jgi:hypothetical protein
MQEAAAPGIFTPPNAKAAASIGRGATATQHAVTRTVQRAYRHRILLSRVKPSSRIKVAGSGLQIKSIAAGNELSIDRMPMTALKLLNRVLLTLSIGIDRDPLGSRSS